MPGGESGAVDAPPEAPLYAVIGDPIAHSLSPAMHSAAIAALGLQARYVPLRTTHQAFPALVRELLAGGGGCNVTSPFKDDAFSLAGRHSADAVRARAVNTIWGDPDQPELDNTDVPAIRAAARRLVGPGQAEVVRVFGTGGAARAAALAAADEFPGVQVEIVSRSAGRAKQIGEWAAEVGLRCSTEADIMTPLDLMIWASPVDYLVAKYPVSSPGLKATYDPPAPPPVLDLTYKAGGTKLVQLMRHGGFAAEDGRGVLIEQGALAFERFFGVPAPRHVMREAVESALGA